MGATLFSYAQQSTKDSIKQVLLQKKMADSLLREQNKLKLTLQRDSLRLSIQLKRKQDSIQRQQLIQDRITLKRQQDSITALRKKFIQDSIFASKQGKLITWKEVEEEKNAEKLRLIKLEQKIALQRKEDSLWAAQQQHIQDSIQAVREAEMLKNKLQDMQRIAEQKRVQDSIAAEQKIVIEKQKQLELQIAIEQKRVQDSIAAEQKMAIEKQKQLELQRAEEQKRIQDSIAAEQKIAIEKQKQLELQQATEQKRIQDSIAQAQKMAIEKQKLADQLQAAAIKHMQDSIAYAQKKSIELQKKLEKERANQQKRALDSVYAIQKKLAHQKAIEQKLLAKAQQRVQDSIEQMNKAKALQLKKEKDEWTIHQRAWQDSLQQANDSIQQQQQIAMELAAIRQKRYQDSLQFFKRKQMQIDSLYHMANQIIQQQKEDSIAATDLLNSQKKSSVWRIYLQEHDTSIISFERKQFIADSLATIERIRLQELKYETQRVADSLYWVSIRQQDSAKKIVTLADSILMADTIWVSSNIDTNLHLRIKPNSQNASVHLPHKKRNGQTLFGLQFGISNYLGDLGGNSGIGKKFFYDNNFKKRTYMYAFSLQRNWHAIGLRFMYTHGKIAGSDLDVTYKNKLDNAYYRYKRNLDFQSTISEVSGMLMCRPFQWLSAGTISKKSALQPNWGCGLGYYSFNPQGSYYDEIAQDYIWVDLQPLRTEGQGMDEYPSRKPYRLQQWNIPFSFGFEYALGVKTNLSFEFMGRKLFTDYLDDVSTSYIDPVVYENYFSGEDLEIARSMQNKSSIIDPDQPFGVGEQRGNPANKDFYYSFSIRLSVKLSK